MFTFDQRHSVFNLVGPLDGVEILGGDSRRRAIMFAFTQGGFCYVGPAASAITLECMGVVAVNENLTFLWKDWGTILTRPWFAAVNGAGTVLNVTELIQLS